ncbi:hypothetical protein GUJ93_ZPchr0282g22927 [Zizania palustris]|uniref:Uncharacterized protein n=1 Tax=Zizania palustris TaxID=103762 RepID=A0A8J5TGV9_ZIZPA|nr:hypothetical protein GUJ93_ZPchr0282g22927 [Zizania palustris]
MSLASVPVRLPRGSPPGSAVLGAQPRPLASWSVASTPTPAPTELPNPFSPNLPHRNPSHRQAVKLRSAILACDADIDQDRVAEDPEFDPTQVAIESDLESAIFKGGAILENNVRVFSVLPAQRSFDVRKECSYQENFYLLPDETTGMKDDSLLHNRVMINIIREYRKVLSGRRPKVKGASSAVNSMSSEMGVDQSSSDDGSWNYFRPR